MQAVVCAYGAVGHACLDALLDQGVAVRLVLAHEDAPGEKIWFPSVAELARSAGVRVIAPSDANRPEVIEEVAGTKPDFLFSFYYRQMMSERLLKIASRGALNLHGSLLPRYRGRAPVNWVLVHGETTTGVTLHYMDAKPDHGDIVAQRSVDISRDDTALTLTRKLAEAGRSLLHEAIPMLANGTAPRLAQDHSRSTYFGGRRPEDGRIDWLQPAESIRNLVRAVTDPWPGAFSWLGRRKVFVWTAEVAPGWAPSHPGEIRFAADGTPLVATGQGALALLELEEEGGPRSAGAAWARSSSVKTGTRFEEEPHPARGEMCA